MKACPFCEAELRDSVIKCTRCGRSLLADPDAGAEHERVPASATGLGLGAPTVSGGTRGSKVGFPPASSTSPVEQPTSQVWASPSTRPTHIADSAPSTRPTHGDSSPSLIGLRALPSDHRRSAKPDFALLLAALATIGAAVLAWRSIGDPWVRLVITDTSDRLDPQLVGDMVLRGHAAMVGVIGQGIGAVLGVSGILWFFYGFDRGSTPPWFTNPGIAILASIAGLIGTVMAAIIWFVWEDAAVQHARAVKMTVDELRALLDLQPEPLVEIERLSGLMRFGGAMVIGLLAGCAAWWSYHKRS